MITQAERETSSGLRQQVRHLQQSSATLKQQLQDQQGQLQQALRKKDDLAAKLEAAEAATKVRLVFGLMLHRRDLVKDLEQKNCGCLSWLNDCGVMCRFVDVVSMLFLQHCSSKLQAALRCARLLYSNERIVVCLCVCAMYSNAQDAPITVTLNKTTVTCNV